MRYKEEFYFVRHGQTDHNIIEGKDKGNLNADIPLNETGRSQAKMIEPLISSLPIRSVCSSPLKRALETKQIITSIVEVDHYTIDELGECSAAIWNSLVEQGVGSPLPNDGMAGEFIERVRTGLRKTLTLPPRSLIVSHGGVHLALCAILAIENHDWIIGNCVPVHFYLEDDGKWKAKKMISR